MLSRLAWTPVCSLPTRAAVFLQSRFKKTKKRKCTRTEVSPEHDRNRGPIPISREERANMVPESGEKIARTVRGYAMNLASNGAPFTRKPRDYNKYAWHTLMRQSGLTHDSLPDAKRESEEGSTPLSDLQKHCDESGAIPKSWAEGRFDFPHMLFYNGQWGAPSVDRENRHDPNSPHACAVAFRLQDLSLTKAQDDLLIEAMGPNRYDRETGAIVLEVDTYNNVYHNAALLGDMLQRVLEHVRGA